MTVRGTIAAIRFGFGRRLGEAAPADPEAWLLDQVEHADPPDPGPPVAEVMRARYAVVLARRVPNPVGDAAEARQALNRLIADEGEAFARRRLLGRQPFRERLVDFWTNHFTVSRRAGIGGLTGSFERDAIRPHVTGNFADMLLAVARHPAMLTYLDNFESFGPNSPGGRRLRRGLNENLAREMLELHTLSPAGGYTQGDVQQLARILTGWSILPNAEPYGFLFRVYGHEPGEKALLGRRFPPGEQGGEAALRFLAGHPATHRHLAVKLARHFVADDPPPPAVRAVEGALRDSHGDLGAAARALVRLPQAWDPPLGKFRTPMDYVFAAGRALGLEQPRSLLTGLTQLDQPLWTALQPNGWGDTAADWNSPEALMRRVDWAYTVAGRAGRVDAMQVAEAALGPLGKAETAAEVARAGSVRDALTIILGSPEFMRR